MLIMSLWLLSTRDVLLENMGISQSYKFQEINAEANDVNISLDKVYVWASYLISKMSLLMCWISYLYF